MRAEVELKYYATERATLPKGVAIEASAPVNNLDHLQPKMLRKWKVLCN